MKWCSNAGTLKLSCAHLFLNWSPGYQQYSLLSLGSTMSMWMLLMWMSNVLLHTLLCCHHKITLMARETHDGWIPHQAPFWETSQNFPNNSLHFVQFFFSLPGHWKGTRYFLLLPRLHYYRALYRYLKWLDSKGFLSWQSIRARSFVPWASDQ